MNIAIPQENFSFFVPSSTFGTSQVTNQLGAYVRKTFNQLCNSFTFGGALNDTYESIYEVYKESSEKNWDGYDALPVTDTTFNRTLEFFNLLPTSIPKPEIVAEPTGEIGIEWYKGKDRVFVVSIGERNTLHYAGIFGINKSHGTEYFRESIPLIILANIDRVYS